MIPYHSELGELTRQRLPETTFYLDKDTQTVQGMTDGHAAARQAAWIILHTERYRHVIYSFNFGTEFADLPGRDDGFLFPEIKRRVTEALMMDDRITGTSDFTFARRRTQVEVRFVVHTVFGDAEMEFAL
ncbi:MAG: DUF2634 domain-containing protein [Oscillospiraceae bacterium]|nr:DUF2634 domain-containing protein [Oscillospiraceae bacterium]